MTENFYVSSYGLLKYKLAKAIIVSLMEVMVKFCNSQKWTESKEHSVSDVPQRASGRIKSNVLANFRKEQANKERNGLLTNNLENPLLSCLWSHTDKSHWVLRKLPLSIVLQINDKWH